ncbi:hypothetical protein AB0C98_23295 [Streptomyces sp. NPDC048558]|uniref:hypothetical protein n=1 Tax=Streptomyces sp. NPDC048558 TaxID=3155759 RepID=UPI003426FB83
MARRTSLALGTVAGCPARRSVKRRTVRDMSAREGVRRRPERSAERPEEAGTTMRT